MKNKFWKQAIAILLTVCTVLAITGCAKSSIKRPVSDRTEPGDLSWLNTTGSLPLVNEGVEKGLTIAVCMNTGSPSPEETWFYQFIEEHMNINLSVIRFTSTNASKYLSLLFADDDLPDIIIGGGFAASDLMTIGANEGQLIDLAPYITEELTPNLYQVYSENPNYLNAVADKEGHIWSLGYINDPTDRGQIERVFWNYDWLEQLGLEVPETLDEALTALRAFKTLGDNIIPVGGSSEANSLGTFFLNAFGYSTGDSTGLSICYRDGEIVLPVADREAYGEYLKFMNTLYTEGLISSNYFTMSDSKVESNASAGLNGLLAQAPFVYMSDTSAWWGAVPLTSEYNEEAFWPAKSEAVSCGGFVITSACQEVELAMAFADWFYNPVNYDLATNGPCDTQTEYLGELSGYHVTVDETNHTASRTWTDYVNNKLRYSSKNKYLTKKVQLWGFKKFGLGCTTEAVQFRYLLGDDTISDGYADVSAEGIDAYLRKTIINDGEQHFRCALEDTLVPYVTTESMLGYAYLDPSLSIEVGNMFATIKEYAASESAKFITGRRPLSELDAYFDEIEALGAKEYVEIYRDYYEQ